MFWQYLFVSFEYYNAYELEFLQADSHLRVNR